MVKNILCNAIAAAFLVGATVASAAPFGGTNTLTFGGAQEGPYFAATISTNGGASYYNVSGGEFFGWWGTANSAPDFFRFFCIELNEYVTNSATYNANFISTVSDSRASNVAKLFDSYYPNKNDGSFYSFQESKVTNFGNWTNPDFSDPHRASSLALQLAVWELWTDPTDLTHSLSAGNFRATQDNYYGGTSPIVAEAQAMLNNLNAGSTKGWSVYNFTREGNQDFLSVSYVPGDTNVPEPGSLALLGLGLAGLGFTRKVKLV